MCFTSLLRTNPCRFALFNIYLYLIFLGMEMNIVNITCWLKKPNFLSSKFHFQFSYFTLNSTLSHISMLRNYSILFYCTRFCFLRTPSYWVAIVKSYLQLADHLTLADMTDLKCWLSKQLPACKNNTSSNLEEVFNATLNFHALAFLRWFIPNMVHQVLTKIDCIMPNIDERVSMHRLSWLITQI